MKEPGFIHRYVAGTGQGRFITLLLLHGTGGDENDLILFGESLVAGAALLSPRGKVLENGMPRFFRRLAEGVFDQEDLRQRTRELAEFIGTARSAYSIQGKMVAVGFSNGANMAASLMLRYPGLLDGAALLRPMVPFDPERSPDLSGRAVLISAGRFDRIVPEDQTMRLQSIFEAAGATVTVQWMEADHELRNEDVEGVRSWVSCLV